MGWTLSQRRFRLVLAALPILALANVSLRGIDGTVDLLVVLMVGVALGGPRYFVDPLVGLLRVLLGVGLRLLRQVVDSLTLSSNVSHSADPPAWPRLPARLPRAGHRCADVFRRVDTPSQMGSRG